MDPLSQAVLVQTLGGIVLSLASALGGFLLKHWTTPAAPKSDPPPNPPPAPGPLPPHVSPIAGGLLQTALAQVEQQLASRIGGILNTLLSPPSAK